MSEAKESGAPVVQCVICGTSGTCTLKAGKQREDGVWEDAQITAPEGWNTCASEFRSTGEMRFFFRCPEHREEVPMGLMRGQFALLWENTFFAVVIDGGARGVVLPQKARRLADGKSVLFNLDKKMDNPGLKDMRITPFNWSVTMSIQGQPHRVVVPWAACKSFEVPGAGGIVFDEPWMQGLVEAVRAAEKPKFELIKGGAE